jgi:hypothetical protein
MYTTSCKFSDKFQSYAIFSVTKSADASSLTDNKNNHHFNIVLCASHKMQNVMRTSITFVSDGKFLPSKACKLQFVRIPSVLFIFSLKNMDKHKTGENCRMRSFIICTQCLLLEC